MGDTVDYDVTYVASDMLLVIMIMIINMQFFFF